MRQHRVGIIMNGVTGRMGTNQHLIRSILAIQSAGGVRIGDDEVIWPDPILVGRNADRVSALAARLGVERWSTDLEACLGNADDTVYFDAQHTAQRPAALEAAIAAGKHIYCEKPTALDLDDRAAARHAWPGMPASRTASWPTSCSCPASSSSGGWSTPASSAGSCRSAASSATGCSRATSSRPSVHRGTTGRRTAAGSCSTCSPTGGTCSTHLSAPMRGGVLRGDDPHPDARGRAGPAVRGDGRRRRVRHLRARRAAWSRRSTRRG